MPNMTGIFRVIAGLNITYNIPFILILTGFFRAIAGLVQRSSD